MRLETMKKIGNNPNKEYEVKEAGDENANVEISRPGNSESKETVRQGK